MIGRYTRSEMQKLWSDETRYQNFLKVEIASCYAFMKAGIIPTEDYQLIAEKAKFDLNRIYELEGITKHDVIAFTTAVSENLGSEKKWLHYGLTSTDVVDTALGLSIKDANIILKDDLAKLLATLKTQALRFENTPIMGRTHGMHAEVTSFGLKWALWYDELARLTKHFEEASTECEVGKLSGAVGNYLTTSIEVERLACEKLGLTPVKISTQVISRDRIARYMMNLALIASCLEKMAVEIRHLSRTEIGEVSEAFSAGQKGSSAMPHKKNPISCENICGCARVMKSYINVALENNPLWHERDISHSSAERIIIPDATSLLDYMIVRFNKILSTLVVNETKMLENINLTNGVIYSGTLLNLLVTKGLSREDAYQMIQPLAFKALNEHLNFEELVKTSIISKWLTNDEIKECFNYQKAFKNVNDIYINLGLKEKM